jgi:HKD family nuclease
MLENDEDNNYINNDEEDEVFDLENLLEFLEKNNYEISIAFIYLHALSLFFGGDFVLGLGTRMSTSE